jgi:FlaG/FlaF family flagellin (archaellin)
MNEEQQQNDSSVDKINNLAHKGKTAYNTYKNAKKIYNAAQVARAGWAAGEGVAAAAATSEVWVPVVIIVLIIVVIIIVLFGGASSVNNGNLSGNSSPLPGASYTPFSGNVDDYFTISDASGKYAWLVQELKNNLAIALAYPKYSSMLKGKVNITIVGGRDVGPLGGWAETDSSGNIAVYNKYITTDPTTRKIYIIHETGHTIAYRNGDAAAFYSESTKDTSCYDSAGYIKTYPTAFHKPDLVQHQQESFADSLVDTIFCKTGVCPATGGVSGEDGPINNWPATCVNTYNWMTQNVLVGDISSGPGVSPGPASNNLTSWAKQINDAITTFNPPCHTNKGAIYMYNVMEQAITNGSYAAHKQPGSDCGTTDLSYYCTDLVIDSYNLAGITVPRQRRVKDLLASWPSSLQVRRTNNVNGLQPGDAVFWYYPSGMDAHIDMIYSISVGQNGNGTITTMDSNTNSKFNKFFVQGWKLIGTWDDGANVPIFGLGPR